MRAPGLALLLLLFASPLCAIGPPPLVFEVTNTGDNGPGTLRAAIEMANLMCVPFTTTCNIVSAIAECGTGAPPKIPLDSPLPPITAWNFNIGGRTDAACRSVAPWLELDGSRLKHGNGLSIASDPLTDGGGGMITGLVINGFPENGIAVNGFNRNMQIAGNFIGTDASGERAIPNERGIAVGAGQARTAITGNVISGNRRSAIFLWEAGVTEIRGNRIGVSASLLRLPNGASGVFINTQTVHTIVRDNNIIRHHPHFGIAAARNTKFDLGFNQIADNSLDVDIGLDGPSPNDADETDGILNAPEIFDAVYDPVRDVTTVHGRLKTIGGRYARNVEIFFYVARRLGGYEYATGAGLIGFHDIGSIPDRAIIEIPFTVEIRPFDAPDLFVTAQTVAYNEPLQFLYTSEFSRPVRVNGNRAVKEIGPDVE